MPVQDNDDKRTADQPAGDAEEEFRRKQAQAQEQQQEESGAQKSGKLLPILNAKAEHHQSRIDSLDEKIANQTDKIDRNKAKIEALSAKADKLEDTNRMLKATIGNLPGIGAIIANNEKRIQAIREVKIPKRQEKIDQGWKKIDTLTAKRDRIEHKLNRVIALNDTIKSFSIGFNKERREAFADAMTRLNRATVECLSDKKNALVAQKDQLMQTYNDPATSMADKFRIQQKINDVTKRVTDLESKIMKLARPETHYAEQTNDQLDASMKLTGDIKVSEDFEDFLQKCADFGILVDYNPDHKIDLKFMLAEQKERNPRAKFTRAKTLGYFYESQQIRRRIESYKYQMSHRPTARIIRTTAEKFQQSQGLQNWADRENMKAASKALNEMNASNSTLEELESAAHRAFAEFMVKSTPQFELSDRIHELEKQIPAIEEYRKYKVYYKNYTSLEGKSKKKYGENCRYELDQYHECRKKLKELFPNGIIPKIKDLQDELKKAREDYAKMSAERKALKKEADRLSRLAQQKRDSQRTVQRYLQNEQAAKRKKSQLE